MKHPANKEINLLQVLISLKLTLPLYFFLIDLFISRQWYPTQPSAINSMPSVKSLTKIKFEPGKRGIRRVAMLNKLFMKNITDIMSTGTVAMQVVGRGIEISKARNYRYRSI